MPVSLHTLNKRQRVFDDMLKDAIRRLDEFEKQQAAWRSSTFKLNTKGQDE